MDKIQQNNTTKIRILPDFIANQIAAGEVVQRPESVVKELVENSIDAGADSIVVIVKDSGKQLIHILDNGSGMSSEDLALSIKRHATSKLLTQDDLERIRTFGFRGEALASIASIAHVEIRTKQRNEEIGWKLTSEPAKDAIIEPIKCEAGTQIFVRNLFYNVPARRKFLRSNLTEFRYISDTMLKLALSCPEKRITFYDDDQLIFDLKPVLKEYKKFDLSENLPDDLLPNLENRIIEALGKSFSQSLIPVNYKNDKIRIYGFVSKPETSRQARNNQYFFLNRRSILSKSLSHAVYNCYENILEKNRHPVFMLFIELDFSRVDVNVHPQKHEVKFEDERMVYNSMINAINSALYSFHLIPDISLIDSLNKQPFERIKIPSEGGNNDEFIINRVTGEIQNVTNDGVINRKSDYPFPLQSNKIIQMNPNPVSFNSNISKKYEKVINPAVESAFDLIFKKDNNENYQQNPNHELFSSDDILILGQLNSCYIIFADRENLYIADQSRTEQRIIYERVLNANTEKGFDKQHLLIPLFAPLNSQQLSVAKLLIDEFDKFGIEIEINDDGALIHTFPAELKISNESKLIGDIIDRYIESESLSKEPLKAIFANTVSLVSSIKRGQKLSEIEQASLIQRLFDCENPFITPNGEPTIVKLSFSEIDSFFS